MLSPPSCIYILKWQELEGILNILHIIRSACSIPIIFKSYNFLYSKLDFVALLGLNLVFWNVIGINFCMMGWYFSKYRRGLDKSFTKSIRRCVQPLRWFLRYIFFVSVYFAFMWGKSSYLGCIMLLCYFALMFVLGNSCLSFLQDICIYGISSYI